MCCMFTVWCPLQEMLQTAQSQIKMHHTASFCFTVFFLSYSFLPYPSSYAFPGVVTVTLLQCWTQRVWIGGLLQSSAVSASVLLVSVALLSAGSRSTGLSHCVLAGDPSPTHASSLWSASPVCGCECEWIMAAVAISVFRLVEMACWWRHLFVGRSQLQAIGSS